MRGAALAVALLLALTAACRAQSNVNLYLHLLDEDNVEVFRAAANSSNQVAPGFGLGQVFDYRVTYEASIDSAVVGSAQGNFVQTSNQPQLTVYQEQFTILFQYGPGREYAGDSFSFTGVWVSGTPHEFFILGGTGDLRGVTGTVTLTAVANSTTNAYALDIIDDSSLLKAALARNRARSAATVAWA